MSTPNPAIKLLVFAGVCLAAYFIFWKPTSHAPPDDPWFQSAVIDQSGPVLVKFGAPWCGPCRMLDAELTQLEQSGPAQVVRIDVDEHRKLAQHYGVSSIPRMLLFKDGKVVGDKTGYAPAAHLRTWIASRIR
jgi:thioredoxin 1